MKFAAIAFAFTALFSGCLADPDDVQEHGIIREGCDGPDTDPYRVCEGNGGGGGGTGGGTGGGGTGGGGGGGELCNGGTCPPGQRCYHRGLSEYCGLPPGTRCLVGQEPPGKVCYADVNGWCQCYLRNPPPNTLTSEPDAVDAGQ